MSTQHQQEQQPQQEQSQIDPDTKKHHLQARSLKTDRVFDLVVSDEVGKIYDMHVLMFGLII
mgnify:FL=1